MADEKARMQYTSEYLEKLKRLHLPGFRDIDLSNIMVLIDMLLQTGTYSKESVNEIKSGIDSLCMAETFRYRYIDHGGAILALYSQDYIRADHMKTFRDFCSHFPEIDMLYAERLTIPIRNRRRYLGNRIFVHRAIFRMNRLGFTQAQTFATAQQLLYLRQAIHDIGRLICRKQYSLLLTYFDASMTDAYFVQQFRRRKIPTATLLHGTALSANLPPSGTTTAFFAELFGSSADYILAWNLFSREKLEKLGIPKKRIRVLGSPKCCGEMQSAASHHSGRFGVLLNVPIFDAQNRALIDDANQISKALGMKYRVKYHPQSMLNTYDDLIDPACLDCIVPHGVSINNFAQTVDFSISGNSSVFAEMVSLGHPVYHRLGVCEDDIYADVPFLSYSSALQLIEQKPNLRVVSQKEREYFSGPKDIYRAYKDFFHEFISAEE